MTITKWPSIENGHRRIRPAPAVPTQDSYVRLAWQSNVGGRTDPRRGKTGTPMTPHEGPGSEMRQRLDGVDEVGLFSN
jgi:hypothetical protein